MGDSAPVGTLHAITYQPDSNVITSDSGSTGGGDNSGSSAEAISKAAQNILNDQGEKVNLCTYEDIKQKIETGNTCGKNPKEILKDIWQSCGYGNYKEDETGTRIAACMSKERIQNIGQIMNLVNKMNE